MRSFVCDCVCMTTIWTVNTICGPLFVSFFFSGRCGRGEFGGKESEAQVRGGDR